LRCSGLDAKSVMPESTVPRARLAPSLEYHEEELRIALCPSDPRHHLPSIPPNCRTLLDIGCGMGQTPIALKLSTEIEAYGIDLDFAALKEGTHRVSANITLLKAKGELLPFRPSSFDFVMSRVAMPYMYLNDVLDEASRVLKQDGTIWISLHRFTLHRVANQIRRSFGRRDWRGVIFCLYVLCNTILFHLVGVQVSFRGRCTETFQTKGGIRRAFRRAGLDCEEILLEIDRFFIVKGRKRHSQV